MAPAMRRTETEERLCALAHGDLGALELPAELDAETHRLVQIAALVALDGPLVSWVAQPDVADEADLDLEQIPAPSSRSRRSSAPSASSPQVGDRPRGRARDAVDEA